MAAAGEIKKLPGNESVVYDKDDFDAVVDYLHDMVNDPCRSGHLKSNRIDVDYRRTTVAHTLNYIMEQSPVNGLDIDVYAAGRNSTGREKIWRVRSSDVEGPINYPFIGQEDFDCGKMREYTVDHQSLRKACRQFGITEHQGFKHAYGRCDCFHGTPALDYVDNRRWEFVL